jgi:uncharacterized protein (UPF0128 family)
MENVLEYISSRLRNERLRHEIHKFDSGAVMVDIWKDDLFYVVQIEDKRIGLSLINGDNPGFDTIPDKSYDTRDKFSIDFEKIFQPK